MGRLAATHSASRGLLFGAPLVVVMLALLTVLIVQPIPWLLYERARQIQIDRDE